MSIEISPDPYEDKWFTEELRLQVGTSEEEAVAIAKDWIDQFWIEQSESE